MQHAGVGTQQQRRPSLARNAHVKHTSRPRQALVQRRARRAPTTVSALPPLDLPPAFEVRRQRDRPLPLPAAWVRARAPGHSTVLPPPRLVAATFSLRPQRSGAVPAPSEPHTPTPSLTGAPFSRRQPAPRPPRRRRRQHVCVHRRHPGGGSGARLAPRRARGRRRLTLAQPKRHSHASLPCCGHTADTALP